MDIKKGHNPARRRSYAKKKEVAANEVNCGPITEPISFKGEVIYPCYCILPYITDAEAEASCRGSTIYGLGSTNVRMRQRFGSDAEMSQFVYTLPFLGRSGWRSK